MKLTSLSMFLLEKKKLKHPVNMWDPSGNVPSWVGSGYHSVDGSNATSVWTKTWRLSSYDHYYSSKRLVSETTSADNRSYYRTWSQSEYETWTYLYSYLKTVYELQEDGSWKTIDVQSSSSVQTYRDTTTYRWTETVPAINRAEDNKNKIEDEAGPPPENAEAIYSESSMGGKSTSNKVLIDRPDLSNTSMRILYEEINYGNIPIETGYGGGSSTNTNASTQNIPEGAGIVGGDKKGNKGHDDISYWSGTTWTAEERHESLVATSTGIYNFLIGNSINELADGEFNPVQDTVAVVELGLSATGVGKLATFTAKAGKKVVTAAAKPIINASKPVVESAANAVSEGVSKAITSLKRTGTSADNVVETTVKKVDDVAEGTNKTKYQVGAYKDIKGVEGLDAHHVGQKSLMKDLVENYDLNTAPAINVPKVGHTISGPNGIVSRSTKGIDNARDLLARDIKELRRVYEDIPNSALKELTDLNKKMYPEMRR